MLKWLSYSLQPSTVPVPIRISTQSAPQVCASRAEVLPPLIWNSQDSQAQWSYLLPQHSGACSYVLEASLGHTQRWKGLTNIKTLQKTGFGLCKVYKKQALDILTLRYVTVCMWLRKINSNITSKYFGERLASHSVFTLDYTHDRNTILEVAFNFPNTVHSLSSDSYHAFCPKWHTAEETQLQGRLKLGVQNNLPGPSRLTCQDGTTNPLHHCPEHLSYKP